MRSLTCGLALLALILASTASAQWTPSGLAIVAPPRVGELPKVASDGVGGCYVGWGDGTAGNNDYDVYVQRLDQGGHVVPSWPTIGLMVCNAPNAQVISQMVPDGSGGVFVVWNDPRVPDTAGVYVSRVLADGSIAPGWTLNGVRAMAHFEDDTPQVLADGQGGIFVAVRDFRTATGPTGRDIYLQHLNSTGHPAAGWPADGKPVALAPGHQDYFFICTDGQGGLYCDWTDTHTGALGGYIQHLLPSGDPAPGWTLAGKTLVSGLGAAYLVPRGDGTAMASLFRQGAHSFLDVDYLTLGFDANGDVVPAWSGGPKVLVVAGNDQRDVIVTSDQVGGLYACWTDSRSYSATGSDVFAQRLNSIGDPSPGWPVNGLPIVVSPALDVACCMAVANDASLYGVGFFSADHEGVWAGHRTGAGAVAPTWSVGGEPVTSRVTDLTSPAAAPGTHEDAFVAYEEYYPATFSDGITVQHLTADAPVATQASLIRSDVTPSAVSLEWYSGDGPLRVAAVEREAEGGVWQALATITADGTGNLTYEDRAVAPGSRYGYRLSYASGAGTRSTAETWITVPAAVKFALKGASPNPAHRGDLHVALSLPTAEAAQLELYDLGGRRLSATGVGSLGAGEHTIAIPGSGISSAGVYWLRLTQGGRSATARVAIVE